MKSAPKTNTFVYLALHIAGFSLCILPPAICTLRYFPLWEASGFESCIAGGTALLMVLCAIPIWKLLKKALASYSSYLIWLLLFLIFLALSNIATQMTVISLVGFIGNLLGAVCFHIAKRIKRRAD
jgi:chromate transport protein ChrA